ncbi:hypothetical protein GIB67_003529 [Kingdonia uniflora]|uniref:valine--tRNA ligase n=1 Tax=Kingdonia uniflora TaxID=39325 RepID=A0A7J7MEI8_9MAGN|nr:hypothetical protein GIB67_003529 [Kingdonia uniflora]
MKSALFPYQQQCQGEICSNYTYMVTNASQHRCVFVGNIPYDATEEQLIQICEEVGPVVSFRLVIDRDTGKPKGYGFCEYKDEETALSARRNLQGYDINGRQLQVDFAENDKGADRNHEQGRGGPGLPSNIDAQKPLGGPPILGDSTFYQPIGLPLAASAVSFTAGALGGVQTDSKFLRQGGLQSQPGLCNDPLTHYLSMSRKHLYDVTSEIKAKEKEAKRLKAQKKAEEAAKAQAQKVSGVPKKEKPGKKSWKPDAEEVNPDDFIDPVTPHGEKKQLSRKMAEQYNPNAVEKSWYSWWEKSGFFVADANSSKPSFTIVLPPPNVTGALHIGHGLTAAIQDTIIRWRRMSGYNTLWVPGMDHAGIATQVVVEKKIMRESKLTRHELGREKFVSEVWKWKNEYGGAILNQERRLATSLDWSRECFTMDEQRSKAVTEAFVQLYRENLIYRGGAERKAVGMVTGRAGQGARRENVNL